jgi:hypothetical protein
MFHCFLQNKLKQEKSGPPNIPKNRTSNLEGNIGAKVAIASNLLTYYSYLANPTTQSEICSICVTPPPAEPSS